MKERTVLGFASIIFSELEGDVAQVRELVRYTFLKTITGSATDSHISSVLANVEGKNGDAREPVIPKEENPPLCIIDHTTA